MITPIKDYVEVIKSAFAYFFLNLGVSGIKLGVNMKILYISL